MRGLDLHPKRKRLRFAPFKLAEFWVAESDLGN
jgi:hypothetical protein